MEDVKKEGKQKRRTTAKLTEVNRRKRRKLERKENPPDAAANESRNARKTGLNADALQWKEVSMPDRLEDYEGFFGLEEVDDVDVVRDEKTGQLSFTSRLSYGSAAVGESVVGNGETKTGQVDEDEWVGFGDSPEADSVDQIESTRPKKVRKTANGERVANSSSFSALSLPTADDNDGADVSAWKPLNLSPDTLASLSKLGFSNPTPIQQSAIPEILNGHDVIGKASTGSGKTLAFGIPILEHYLEQRNSRVNAPEKTPLALILSPTRELAHQLDKHLTALCNSTLFDPPAIATLTGGLSIQKQQRLLKTADIVIGTPGRLWEVVSEGQGIMNSLKAIKFLVVDEADRLLSQGHFKEVEEILNALDRQDHDEDDEETDSHTQLPERQTLVFSATFDRGLQRKLATKSNQTGSNNLLSNKESMEYLLTKLNFREERPKFVDVNPISHLATGLKESLVECPAGTDKDLYLYALLLLLSTSRSNLRTLVFTNSISAVKRLTPFLQNLKLPALALHSDMPQKARLRSVERFTSGKGGQACSILVATDVAARGLDIPGVQLVLHYHLPRAADMYVHRSGRTARAGQPGSSILICAPKEVAGVRRLVAKVHATHDKGNEDVRQGHYIRTLDLNRRIVSRLKPRVTLAKKLADVAIAKEKQSKEDDFMRAAAEELGVDYDSETFEQEAGKGRRGRGAGRKKKEKEASSLSKADVAAMKAELTGLLNQKVNVGVSERYLTSGGVDVDALLRERGEVGDLMKEGREFLGSVQGLGLEDV